MNDGKPSLESSPHWVTGLKTTEKRDVKPNCSWLWVQHQVDAQPWLKVYLTKRLSFRLSLDPYSFSQYLKVSGVEKTL